MKFPFLSRLLEIKEEQLIFEENKLELLLDLKELMKIQNRRLTLIKIKMSEIEARIILNEN